MGLGLSDNLQGQSWPRQIGPPPFLPLPPPHPTFSHPYLHPHPHFWALHKLPRRKTVPGKGMGFPQSDCSNKDERIYADLENENVIILTQVGLRFLCSTHFHITV